MLVDARQVSEGSQLEADLCVIGAGAAGLSLALEFVSSKTTVILLESGGFSYEDATQALYQGSARRTFDNGGSVEDVGDASSYLTKSRLRYFGGTTNHWAGWCRPLDDLDLEVRPWVPHSGWPISRDDLEPYYQRANEFMRLKAFDRDPLAVAKSKHGLYGGEELTEFQYKWFHINWLRFGQVYKQDLKQARNVKIVLNANVVNLRSNDLGTALTGLDIKTLTDIHFRVKAKAYVLACGGIENPRLLLSSSGVHSEGIGNAHDIVGRFFMEHPHTYLGRVCLPVNSGKVALFDRRKCKQTANYLAPVACPSDETQRKHGLLNFSAELQDAWNQFGHWSKLSRNLAWYAQDIHRCAGRYANKVSDASVNQGFYRVLFARAEQTPNPNSRVSLSRKRDRLGVPVPFLDWRLTRADMESLYRNTELFAQNLGRKFLGRGSIDIDVEEPQQVTVGNHHIGTTRMSAGPSTGVVDRNCKVFGMVNLYVAGSSVFPTAGFANPTYTIVALALRLADHLKHESLKL